MTKTNTIIQKSIALILIVTISGVLGSCVFSPQPGQQSAKPDAATESPNVDTGSDTSNPPVDVPTVIPTNTPIPEASGYILYVSNQDGGMNLYMTSPDGAEQKRLTASSSSDSTPNISPDGARIAYVSTVDGNMDVYLLDIATLTATRLTNAPQKDSAPSWSADGTLVAFESFRDGNFEIYVTEALGATLTSEADFAQRQASSKGLLTQKRLTTNPTGDHSPLWSPTRMEIAYQSDQVGNGYIYLVDVDGNQTQVTNSPEADFAHSWSPDGNMLAYKLAVGGDLSKICVIERTGQNPFCVTRVPSEYSAPVWSPDGKFLAASAKQTKGYGIDVFRVTDVTDIAGAADTVTHLFNAEVDPRGAPFWAPDGLRLVVQAKATDGNMDLFSALIPSNEFTRLTSTAAYDGEPVWVTK